MMFLQFLSHFFREAYINSLIPYLVDFKDKQIENLNIYNELPDWLKKELKTSEEKDSKDITSEWYNTKKNRKFYLIHFKKMLNVWEAELEIKRLGLMPANIFETIFFFNKFGSKLSKKSNIISLGAYRDTSKRFNYSSGYCSYCLNCVNSYNHIEFISPGESDQGEKFFAGINFLVKSI